MVKDNCCGLKGHCVVLGTESRSATCKVSCCAISLLLSCFLNNESNFSEINKSPIRMQALKTFSPCIISCVIARFCFGPYPGMFKGYTWRALRKSILVVLRDRIWVDHCAKQMAYLLWYLSCSISDISFFLNSEFMSNEHVRSRFSLISFINCPTLLYYPKWSPAIAIKRVCSFKKDLN